MDVQRILLQFYWDTRDVITPTLAYSQHLYEQILDKYVMSDTDWLEVGCGHRLLPKEREKEETDLVRRCKQIVGIDADMLSLQKQKTIPLRVRGDVTWLPFADESFELVTANMVVEHLDKPAAQFAEVKRVLKPGGHFIFHTPNSHGYFSLMRRLVPTWLNQKLAKFADGRAAEDIFPVQYKANTRKEIEELAREVGFTEVKVKMVVTDAIFSPIPPVMVFELIWIRALMTEPLKPLRTNIIAIFRKSPFNPPGDGPDPEANFEKVPESRIDKQ
jgi:ubiquinone/menaquinone biosynthesis C-methylase UbiE